MKFLMSILLFLMLLYNAVRAQVPTAKEIADEYEKYSNYDCLNHKYKYLDKNYKIRISSELFQRLLKENKFYPEAIKTYNDSIGVVMCGEFERWPQRNIASYEITFSWLRMGYILWITESQAKELGRRYAFKMPYQLHRYIYDDSEKWDSYMIGFMSDLRSRISKHTKKAEVINMPYKEFLRFALVNSPARIKDAEALSKTKSADGCGKPNCSHGSDSTKTNCDKN